MTPINAAQLLQNNELAPPELNVLKPNLEEYSVLLYQPQGELLISPDGVSNRDTDSAIAMCGRLLERAAQDHIGLLATPEYSVPWQALVDTLVAGHGPPPGCLWALGCESLTLAELDHLQTRFQKSAHVVLVPVDRPAAEQKRFLDPLAYVFRTRTNAGAEVVVVLIQFKTHPSIDTAHIESTSLALGSHIVVFGTVGQTIGLYSFICSDVLGPGIQSLTDLYDRSLVLHLQLNPKPRESSYRDYRKKLFGYPGDATELICLNWAAGVRSWSPGALNADEWKNIGGSAWYLRPDRFDYADDAIGHNHRRGIYYTWHDTPKCNVLFLNYQAGAYQFITTKVWQHLVPAVQAKRTGPRLQSVLRWDATALSWVPSNSSEDGFASLIAPWAASVPPLQAIYAACPIAAERILALLKRAILDSPFWHHVRELRSFRIEEAEFIRRITFAQDPDAEIAVYRKELIQHFVSSRQIFDSWTEWPPELSDIKVGYAFNWDPRHPNSSVRSTAGNPASLIYAGEDPDPEDLQRLGDALRAALLQSGHRAERVGVFYRAGGQTKLWRHPQTLRYDQAANTTPKSFTDGIWP